MKISNILATKGAGVITIRPDQSVREAIASFVRYSIGALVVVNEFGYPVGIISERDIIFKASEIEILFSLPIHSVMTQDVVTAIPQDDLDAVANTMTKMRIRHLPVVDRGKLIGIVSIGDVVKAQRDDYRGEVETLQDQLIEVSP
jgi:CBS domain-containing protein